MWQPYVTNWKIKYRKYTFITLIKVYMMIEDILMSISTMNGIIMKLASTLQFPFRLMALQSILKRKASPHFSYRGSRITVNGSANMMRPACLSILCKHNLNIENMGVFKSSSHSISTKTCSNTQLKITFWILTSTEKIGNQDSFNFLQEISTKLSPKLESLI